MKWLIWSLSVLFFLYEFILRISPSVMVTSLMQAFSVNAEALGTLSAFYLYIYAPMQFPVGVLMDRYGARQLLTVATFSCGVGGILFGMATVLAVADMGRLLMGFGSAFAFVGMTYICSHWFPSEQLSLLIGISNSIGMLGAVFGEGPLSVAVDHWGWRPCSIGLGIAGFVLAASIFLVVRNMPQHPEGKPIKTPDLRKAMNSFWTVCKNRYTWINATLSLLLYSITVAFAGLWAVPFLQEAYGLSNEAASFGSSMIFIGWITGGPLIGHISALFHRRKPILRYASLILLVLFCLLVYYPKTPETLLYILLFFIGYFSSAQLLTFSLAVRINPFWAKGSALAITNFMTMLGGAILQPLVGEILDRSTAGYVEGIIVTYPIEAYQNALSVFPICLFAAFLLSFLLPKEPLKKNLLNQR